ncbi:MAG TPA: nucleotide exchange factor GrpE [Polyangia bacterium]|jgi:molecular chaperone GrpE|nr:nucleotide exchange factor GrpE [Polyangia bacterium]
MSDRDHQTKQNGAGTPAGAPAEAGAAAAAPTTPMTPEERIAALEAERNEAKDRMLRVAADFENFKKRARISQTEAETTARERVLRDVLDVADNLERATDAHGAGAADVESVLKGVTLVLRVIQQKLERHEVRPFESKGQVFDPRIHEAISRVESAEVPAGAVAVELQKGYRIGDKLLRPAMVSVSSGPAAGASGNAQVQPDGQK